MSHSVARPLGAASPTHPCEISAFVPGLAGDEAGTKQTRKTAAITERQRTRQPGDLLDAHEAKARAGYQSARQRSRLCPCRIGDLSGVKACRVCPHGRRRVWEQIGVHTQTPYIPSTCLTPARQRSSRLCFLTTPRAQRLEELQRRRSEVRRPAERDDLALWARRNNQRT
jgi:hypothetical protein